MTPKEVIEFAGEEVLEDEIADLHDEIARLRAEKRISHVLIFSGEVPEAVLCTSIDDVKNRVSDAFLFEDELKEQFSKDLDLDDNWSFDESGNRFCFSTGIGV